MENIIFNELRYRGFSVDVGVVEVSEKSESGGYRRKQTEIDFVANRGNQRYYLQSAFTLRTEEKKESGKTPAPERQGLVPENPDRTGPDPAPERRKRAGHDGD